MNAIRFVRRRICLATLAASMALAASSSVWAAEELAVAKKRPVRQEKSVEAPPAAEAAADPSTRIGDSDGGTSIGQVVFQVLLAEVALRRGDAQLATDAYADLAFKTRDPKLLERTVDIAGFARRPALSLEAARRWVEVEPESKQARLVFASVMIISGQTEELPALLTRMLEADPAGLPENLLGLNRMLARMPDRRAAAAVVEKVAQSFAGVAEAHYAIAVAAASVDQAERARAEARRALELRPDWDPAALLHAQLLSRLSVDEALGFLQGFVNRNPSAREARMQLARLLVGARRYGEARRYFEEVLKIAPESPDAVYSLGILALQQNELSEGEAQFKRFLAIPAADKNYAYFFLGQIAEERRQPAEALKYYALMTGSEHYIQSRLRSARLLADQGRLAEARQQLSTVRGGSSEEQIQLAIAEAGLLRDAKQSQAAFDLLDALLTKHPEQPELLYESALLAEKLGNLPLMETRLRKLIVLRPESAQAYNAIGYSLADRNLRLGEARALIEQALKLSPEDFFILDSMGWVLYRQGDLAGALAYLEQAYARRDDPEVAAHIGEVLWAMGRQDEARKRWLDAQKKHPDNESLNEAIQKFLR